jgi:hypothetical protein
MHLSYKAEPLSPVFTKIVAFMHSSHTITHIQGQATPNFRTPEHNGYSYYRYTFYKHIIQCSGQQEAQACLATLL